MLHPRRMRAPPFEVGEEGRRVGDAEPLTGVGVGGVIERRGLVLRVRGSIASIADLADRNARSGSLGYRRSLAVPGKGKFHLKRVAFRRVSSYLLGIFREEVERWPFLSPSTIPMFFARSPFVFPELGVQSGSSSSRAPFLAGVLITTAFVLGTKAENPLAKRYAGRIQHPAGVSRVGGRCSCWGARAPGAPFPLFQGPGGAVCEGGYFPKTGPRSVVPDGAWGPRPRSLLLGRIRPLSGVTGGRGGP